MEWEVFSLVRQYLADAGFSNGVSATAWARAPEAWAAALRCPATQADTINGDERCLRWFDTDGKLHRADGPAVMTINGYEAWYWQGKRHCSGNGPALVDPCAGRLEWYEHGRCFRRRGGPSRIEDRGVLCWTNERGLAHRLDGPARYTPDGIVMWCYDGLTHRGGSDGGLPGPALLRPSGTLEWYTHGVLSRGGDDLPAVIGWDGRHEWFNTSGERHRLAGPAVERADGTRVWYRDNIRYREVDGDTGVEVLFGPPPLDPAVAERPTRFNPDNDDGRTQYVQLYRGT